MVTPAEDDMDCSCCEMLQLCPVCMRVVFVVSFSKMM